jgi:hypothetical protein
MSTFYLKNTIKKFKKCKIGKKLEKNWKKIGKKFCFVLTLQKGNQRAQDFHKQKDAA